MRPRNVLVMLVIAVLAVLAFFALQGDDGSGKPKLPATLPVFEKSAVTKISATNNGTPLVLRRRADRSDAWEVEVETATVRADANAIDELLMELARQDVRAQYQYERDKLTEADIKGYGLDAPQTSIELTVPGKTILVRFGKKTREGTGWYVDNGPKTDVWVVGGNVVESLLSHGETGYRSNRLTDVRLFDIGNVEIVKGGVTLLQAERDTTQIWRVTQPFNGFADPDEFQKLLGKLAGTDVLKWVEIDARNLKERGLDPPVAEVRLTAKKGGEPSVVLVGNAEGESGVYVVEKGTRNVALSPKRLLDAILELEARPDVVRDRSFTRIGIDGTSISVKLGSVVYELRKEGASWDVTKPERFPGDDAAIRDAMEKIRSWKALEFADAAKPEEKGIKDGGDSIEIELAGNARTTLRIGDRADAMSWWAQRKSQEGVGGVERVDGSVIDLFAKGYPQFMRKQVRDFAVFMGDLLKIEREAGQSDEGKSVKSVVVAQDSARDVAWDFAVQGPGAVGTLDTAALQRLLGALRTIMTKQWLFWDDSKDAEMGFKPPFAETLTITLKFAPAAGTPPGGLEQTLLVGKKAPTGGYYARFANAEGWAFILSEADVEALKVPLAK